MVDNHIVSADGDTFFIVLLPINYQSKVEQASKKLGTQRSLEEQEDAQGPGTLNQE